MKRFDDIYTIVKKDSEDKDNKLIFILALIGGALVVALIAYAVYRFLTPDYFEDYDDDDDFDDDFDVDWDDDDEEEASDEEEAAPAEEPAAEEEAEEPAE